MSRRLMSTSSCTNGSSLTSLFLFPFAMHFSLLGKPLQNVVDPKLLEPHHLGDVVLRGTEVVKLEYHELLYQFSVPLTRLIASFWHMTSHFSRHHRPTAG